MPVSRYNPRPSDNAEIRDLQRAVRELQPVDTATVKWAAGPSGIAAHARTAAPLPPRVRRAFEARLALEDDGTWTAYVWRGARKISGQAATSYAPGTGDEWSFAINVGEVVYFGFILSTPTVAGAWMDGDPICGSAPEDDAETVYFPICQLAQDADGNTYLMQLHDGLAVVEDHIVYESCP